MLIMKDPLMKKEKITEYFEKQLRKTLDDEFEEYCTEEDYYQPVVEDFEIEYHVKDWCRENGFTFRSCEGGGDDDGRSDGGADDGDCYDCRADRRAG